MKLLVAYDGSACSDAALEDLRYAGIPDGSDVFVVTVAEVWHPLEPVVGEKPLPAYIPTGLKGLRERAAAELEESFACARRAADRLRMNFPSWHVRVEAYADSPALGILTQADEWKPDLIVVGSRGRSLIGRVMLGSISQKVLTESPYSVRIGRERRRGDASVRLVVCLDGSSDSDAAVAAVVSRQWPAGTAVKVISALDIFFPTSITPVSADLMNWFEESYRQEVERIEACVDAAVNNLTSAGLFASGETVEGAPKQVILKTAAEWEADCIFMGARGARGFERFLLGSVSAAVAARAGCSVEVVRTGAGTPSEG